MELHFKLFSQDNKFVQVFSLCISHFSDQVFGGSFLDGVFPQLFSIFLTFLLQTEGKQSEIMTNKEFAGIILLISAPSALYPCDSALGLDLCYWLLDLVSSLDKH